MHRLISLSQPLSEAQTLVNSLTSSSVATLLSFRASHMLAQTHDLQVRPLLHNFLLRHASDPSPVRAPLDFDYALRVVARLAIDNGLGDELSRDILSRDADDPLSYSLLTTDEVARSQRKLDEFRAREQACRLSLPMRHDPDEWVTREGDFGWISPPTNWKFSTRHEYTYRTTTKRPSIASEVSVEVFAAVMNEHVPSSSPPLHPITSITFPPSPPLSAHEPAPEQDLYSDME